MWTIYKLWENYCEFLFSTHRGQEAGMFLHILQEKQENIFVHYLREAAIDSTNVSPIKR